MGLLAFSQCSALTGPLKTVSVRVAYSGRADRCDATSARHLLRRGVGVRQAQRCGNARQDLPILDRFARRVECLRGGLHHSLIVGVGRVLLDPRGARQHDVGNLCQLGLQHTLVNHDGDAAALARVDQPRQVAHRSVGPGVDDVEDRDAILIDRGAQRRQIGVALVLARDGESEILRAVEVRRIDRRHAEFGIRRLRFFCAPPRHMHMRGAAIAFEILGDALEQVHLFMRRVRRGQHAHRRGILAPRGIQQIADTHQRILPRHDLLHAALRIDQRFAQPLLAFDPQVLEAADIAHPEIVDRRVVTRRDAREPGALRPFGLGLEPASGAAAFRAQRAGGVDGVRVIPRTRAEPVPLWW